MPTHEGVGMDAGPMAAVGAGSGGVRKRKGRGETGAAMADTVNKKPRSLCPHQRRRSQCKECGGAGLCPHQRQRSRCKECGGAGICPHQRIRSQCKECGGAALCSHERIRSRCKVCRAEADKSMPAGLEEYGEAGV